MGEIERCYDCGGHLKGYHLGFEATCRCFRGRRPKRADQPSPATVVPTDPELDRIAVHQIA